MWIQSFLQQKVKSMALIWSYSRFFWKSTVEMQKNSKFKFLTASERSWGLVDHSTSLRPQSKSWNATYQAKSCIERVKGSMNNPFPFHWQIQLPPKPPTIHLCDSATLYASNSYIDKWISLHLKRYN